MYKVKGAVDNDPQISNLSASRDWGDIIVEREYSLEEMDLGEDEKCRSGYAVYDVDRTSK